MLAQGESGCGDSEKTEDDKYEFHLF
jgi:hypothetical protein